MVLPGLFKVLLGFTGFCCLSGCRFYCILSSGTRFHWVAIGFTGLYWVFFGLQWALLGFTGFSGFYWIIPHLVMLSDHKYSFYIDLYIELVSDIDFAPVAVDQVYGVNYLYRVFTEFFFTVTSND